jgi:hypothetical protein
MTQYFPDFASFSLIPKVIFVDETKRTNLTNVANGESRLINSNEC